MVSLILLTTIMSLGVFVVYFALIVITASLVSSVTGRSPSELLTTSRTLLPIESLGTELSQRRSPRDAELQLQLHEREDLFRRMPVLRFEDWGLYLTDSGYVWSNTGYPSEDNTRSEDGARDTVREQ